MPILLVVHHTPSPNVSAMLEAVLSGARDDDLEGVEVRTRAALAASVADVLDADGYVLGTPANIGYMSGALKHFFDQVYYPCMGETDRRPYGLFVHGNHDTTGARKAVESIAGALSWRRVAEPVEVTGEPSRDQLEACAELGGTVAATLALESSQ